MKINPILAKDLKVMSRSMRYSWILFGYETVLGVIFLFALLIGNSVSSYSDHSNIEIFKSYVYFFPIIGSVQMGIIAFLVPILTASSISGEKEKQTYDVLLTTTISPLNIVLGKLGTAIFRVMLLIFASVPLMALSFIVGGLSWLYLLVYMFLALAFSINLGSIGIFCSSVCRKSITSIILSYVIFYGINTVSTVPIMFSAIISRGDPAMASLLSELVNPTFVFVLFFVSCMSSENFLELFDTASSGSIPDFMYSPVVWIVGSIIVQLLIAALFVFFTTLRLKPSRK